MFTTCLQQLKPRVLPLKDKVIAVYETLTNSSMQNYNYDIFLQYTKNHSILRIMIRNIDTKYITENKLPLQKSLRSIKYLLFSKSQVFQFTHLCIFPLKAMQSPLPKTKVCKT